MEKESINLSVIVPCYNEGEHIYNNLLEMSKLISKFETSFEIICVNDGSKDDTEKEIKRSSRKNKHIKPLGYEKNMGKGYALKTGTLQAKGNLVAFIDSDLELSPNYIGKYIQIMQETNSDVVIASKMHKNSELNYPFLRKILSYGYYILLKILFRLNIKDTQTGLKVFKVKAIKEVMKEVETNGFAFDIEMLVLLNKKGYKIVDAPIKLNFTREHSMGRIKIKDIFIMFFDTIKIFFKVNSKKR